MTNFNFVEYCIHRHDIFVNQKYDDTLPYSVHLHAVNKQYEKFKHLIPTSKHFDVSDGTFGHDLIEDARVSYNELVSVAGKVVADIIYCCTDEKGHTRGERHSNKFFSELDENDLAVFVKLCDVIANVIFSILTNSSMGSKYKKEYPRLKTKIYKEQYKEMFDYLEHLFELIK